MKVITSLFLMCIVVAISLLGYLAMSDMGPHHHQTTGCPFMRATQSICTMGIFDHITNFQNSLTSIIPIIIYCVFVVLMCSHKILVHVKNVYCSCIRRAQEQQHVFNQYQILFSNGILHPKIP